MNVKLVVEKGQAPEQVIVVQTEETVIGRHRDCGVRIPCAEVSRRHCVLTQHEDSLTVHDLDSLNGTFLNGGRVTGTEPVRPGDHLEIGPVTFLVHFEPEAAPEHAALPTATEEATISSEDSATVAIKPEQSAAASLDRRPTQLRRDEEPHNLVAGLDR